MDVVSLKLTVLFDGTFWIGVFEKQIDDKLYVSKHTFGAEPKDMEILVLILYRFDHLSFSNGINSIAKVETKSNPKRVVKLAQKQLSGGIGTKSQQALKLQQEANKVERKEVSKAEREAQKELKFQIRQRKKLEKHKGR